MTNIALIATEDIALNQSDTSPVSHSLGSGAILTPTIAKFQGSGSATGNQYVAYIQSPQSFSSGAILRDFSTECGAKTTAQLVAVGRTKFLKQGGSGSEVIRRAIALTPNFGTLAGTGTWIFDDGDYLQATSATGAALASTSDCVLKANWSELYTSSH